MAIQLKRSATTGNAPSSLVAGEVAINEADGLFFYRNSGGSVVSMKLTSSFTGTGSMVLSASPTFTGTPISTTAAADTNTTQIATTAFVLGQASATTPVVNGTAAVGTATRFARADHVHPTDTTRAPLASPTFTGTVTAPAEAITNTTASTSTTTGALTVAGGVGIGQDVYVARRIIAAGATGNINVSSGTMDGFSLYETGAGGGVISASATADTVCYFRRRTTDGAMLAFYRDTTGVGNISVTSSATTFNSTSDVRGKPNRELLSPEVARSTVDALKIWDFDKDGNAIRGIGVVAQEAYEVHKSFATPGEKPEDWWGAEKAAPVPFMIVNLQQANARIDALEKQIAALEKRLSGGE